MAFIFLYGRPGSGKTTLAASMTKLGYKVLFLDIDDKVREMINLKPLVDSGQIKVIPIMARITETSLEDRLKEMQKVAQKIPVLSKEPQGYLEYCKHITVFEKEMSESKTSDYQVLVCDSLTTLQEHMRRLILHMSKREKFTYDEWDIWKSNLEEFAAVHRRLQNYFKHVIIISHEALERDELIGKIEIVPMIDGSMKYKMAAYFTEVYHCFVEVKNNIASFKVATKPLDRADARTSRKLDIVADADFSTLFADERQK